MKEFKPEATELLMLELAANPTSEPEYIGGKHRRRERRKAERKLNKKRK
ncbi:hypothetical protein M2T28_14580 [Elizabethkingia miricola]|nr:hypothetical protein [Elizabethkingia miricola]MCL1653846.1 hypothetical protein [Elizabethkingia miricola]WQM37638.1 hypothetical protein U2S95_14860 [Elizabethkingia miricola]CRH24884.1 Uncharacterised protein [Chlamydia trachomatis]